MLLRVLFLADTHLGFDLPLRPRIRRRRRGEDFLANYHRALEPALAGEADLVVHGGDVFHRPRVPASLVHQAFEPLKRIADSGVPVFVVPGNHERSLIPHSRLAAHPGIHLFDRPRSFGLEVRGARVRLFGFPYQRKVRRTFPGLLRQMDLEGATADISLLCVHHCFEGSRVEGYTFRNAPDVVRGMDVPGCVGAILTGHIHRHQVLHKDLTGRSLGAPVFYPGSVERTSFAERREPKGYLHLGFTPGGAGGRVAGWRFQELPARPMIVRELNPAIHGPADLAREIDGMVADSPPNAVLRLRVRGYVPEEARPLLAAARLRARSPDTMNLDVVYPDEGRRTRAGRVSGAPVSPEPLLL